MSSESDSGTRTIPTRCADCETTLDSPLFCESCRKLYPADGFNFFELFGLIPRYDIDAELVRGKYFGLARGIHPDRIGVGDQDTQGLSLRVSAKINEAYRVLLDPFLRAEYLLEVFGGKASSDDKHVSQSVLSEMFMLREEIDDARSADDQQVLTAIRERVAGRYDATIEEIAALARRLPGDDEIRKTLREKLNAIRYYRKTLDDL